MFVGCFYLSLVQTCVTFESRQNTEGTSKIIFTPDGSYIGRATQRHKPHLTFAESAQCARCKTKTILTLEWCLMHIKLIHFNIEFINFRYLSYKLRNYRILCSNLKILISANGLRVFI